MNFAALSRLASGHVEARILHTAVDLGIFELLAAKRLSAPRVASALRTDPRATELLLNALAALDLLRKTGRGVFALSAVSRRFLLSNSPQYFGDMVRFESALWPCWGQLATAVRSGRPARSPDMYQNDPHDTRRFICAMHSLVAARGDADVLARTLDLRGVADLLDVGAGPATYPVALCRRHPGLRATIFDLPGTLKITQTFMDRADLTNRVRLVPGDYRVDPIPGKYDVVFLSNIIHSESGKVNGSLMKKLYQSLHPGGRIVIKDHILDESRARPPVGAVFSLLMLLTTQAGRCYSFAEIKRWLLAAGFKRITKVPLPQPLTSSLVIGKKD
jgi:SAM-dependent methyltransferase